jgi:hypothetical protein
MVHFGVVITKLKSLFALNLLDVNDANKPILQPSFGEVDDESKLKIRRLQLRPQAKSLKRAYLSRASKHLNEKPRVDE